MRGLADNSTTIFLCNTAIRLRQLLGNLNLLINELAQCGIESDVLRNPAKHIAIPLYRI